jgi:SAM-dependent methyltransferase
MRPAEYEAMYRVEDTHWWYGALRDHVTRAVTAETRRLGRPPRVLDAGAGTGGMLARLGGAFGQSQPVSVPEGRRESSPAPSVLGSAAHMSPVPEGRLKCAQDFPDRPPGDLGELFGIEIAPEGLGFCRKRGLERMVRGSVSELPFAAASFDIALSLDVLYHEGVPDDIAAARELARVLRPGGFLVLNLPAYPSLRGAHDEAIHTARRYTRPGVARLLREAGFTPERITHWNALLLPIAAASRLLSRLRPGEPTSDVHPVSPPLNALLAATLRLESAWSSRHDLTFGLSILALARKQDRNG